MTEARSPAEEARARGEPITAPHVSHAYAPPLPTKADPNPKSTRCRVCRREEAHEAHA